MPVQSETSRIQYSGNGSSLTPYAVPFLFLAKADLVVVVTDASGSETTLAETTDYTITGAGSPCGGTVVTKTAVPPASTLTIYREPVATQLTEFQATGRLPASTLTEGLDRLTMLVQSLLRKVTRCLRFTDSSQHISPMPGSGRASHLLGFNSSGDAQLYDRTTLLSLLSLGGSLTPAPTAFWADDGERAAKTPDFTGQLGLQLDDSSLWRAASPTPGHWTLLALDEDALTSNSPRLPPTQQSIKAYVDAEVAGAIAGASAYTDAATATLEPLSLTLVKFTPRDNQPPANNWARVNVRNNVSTLRFSDSVTEGAVFLSTMPQGIPFSGLQVQLHWSASSATSGDVTWNAAIERMNTDIDTDGFATEGTATSTTSSTSGVLTKTTILPAIDNLQPGELFRLRIRRDTTAVTDTMSGDAELVAIEIWRVA